jgi:hypothetical protein
LLLFPVSPREDHSCRQALTLLAARVISRPGAPPGGYSRALFGRSGDHQAAARIEVSGASGPRQGRSEFMIHHGTVASRSVAPSFVRARRISTELLRAVIMIVGKEL